MAVAAVSAVNDWTRSGSGTVNRRLATLLDLKTPSHPSSVKGVATSDITVDASRNLWFRLFVPTATAGARLPVVVFFHGGGFVFMGPNSYAYDAVCRRFARRFPAVVVSVNYRLAPEHKWPSQYDDGFDVLKFLDGDAGKHRMMPESADLGSCFLAGDSAGGNLCHHVALRAGGGGGGFEAVKVVGVVAIQPFFGGEERTEAERRLSGVAPLVSTERADWMWRAFLPEGSNRDHEACNFAFSSGVGSGSVPDYPATLVVVGGWDPLKDWQKRYYEWLKGAGKEAYLLQFPESIHAFYLFPELPEASLLISNIKDFIYHRFTTTSTTT